MSTQVLAPSTESARDEGKRLNMLALAGIVFGLISTVHPALGVMPIMGVVFSTLGLVSFDDRAEKMRWMACFGLGLSLLVALLAFR